MSNQAPDSYILSFSEISSQKVDIVGGKGANLGEMTRAGFPVPPGFVVTAGAYRAFLSSSNATKTISEMLAGMRPDDPEDVQAKTERIRNLLVAQAMPAEIKDQVIEQYRRLADELGADGWPRVAVRSSATAEDLPSASFAGQQDTYLNIQGEQALIEHVRRCWASLWTARAVTYRIRQGFEHDRVALAVVVQAMIPSEVSGVLFTANPVTGKRDEAVINASWGLGEAIVSGAVSPDTWVVHKSNGAILSREIASKDVAIEYSKEGGTAEVAVPPEKRNLPALDDQQVVQLATLGQRIADHYHAPMDIEWGYARGRMYVLQARSITTLPAAPEYPSTGEYNRTMFLDVFPDPLSPAFLSTVQPLFHSMLDFTFETWGLEPSRDMPAIGVLHNQPYFHREYIESALSQFRPAVRERLVAQMVNPFGKHERGMARELSPGYVMMMARMLTFMVRFPSQLPGIVSRYRKEVAAVDALDLEAMADAEIFARMRDLVFGTVSRLLNYDFMMIALIGLTYRILGSWLQRYFPKESEEVRAKLVSGVTGNRTMETNKRLWDLAEAAKSSPTVRAALRSGEPDIHSRLEQTQEGRAFLAELDRFLQEYGHREIQMDILYPTWGEDPTPVLAFLRRYLDLDANSSPHRQEERLAKQRQEMALTVEAEVKRDPIGRWFFWPIFRRVLTDTQTHTRERDTMHFELTRVFAPFRHLLLELGRRWTGRRLINDPEDIFFLTLDEIEQLTKSPRPMHEKVKERREELERSKRHPPPSIIRNGQAVGPEHVTAASAGQGEYRGIAGSPGIVTGIARIIRGPEEFDKLQKGEVLVAPFTNPVWTPLFAIAGGVVTEVGGTLSHGAIVAREYGIPAVMTVAGATRLFQDGQRLTVDGSRGIVAVADGAT